MRTRKRIRFSYPTLWNALFTLLTHGAKIWPSALGWFRAASVPFPGSILVCAAYFSYGVAVEKPEKLFANLLNRYLEIARGKNSRFSMRAFAKKIGLSSGTLSEVLSGKLTLSQSRMKTIVASLDLPESKKTRFHVSMGEAFPQRKELVLSSNQDFLADWFNRAVLHFFEIEPLSQGTKVVDRIAKRLGVRVEKVERCVETLLDKKLLTRDKFGRFTKPTQFWETTDNVTSDFVRKHHLSNLAAAEEALIKVPTAQRDFTSLMFAGNRQQVEELRAEIRSFYDRALAIMEDGDKDEIFQIAISVYPLTLQESALQREEL